jgi:hypothetical protein
MSVPSLLNEPGRIDEPRAVEAFSDVLTQVASEGRALIVCRDGADLAAVIPLEHLALLREVLARADAEKMAGQIDWDALVVKHGPPQQWLEDDDNPFEPEEAPAP